MAINNTILYTREVNLSRVISSIFLFGPRMTGKTKLLEGLNAHRYFDLLDPEIELKFNVSPKLFWEEISALPQGSKIVVDEIQRVPVLLDYIQMGIEKLNHQFFLSGSSARKLKRGGANLLGGRALEFHLHPLTVFELGKEFNINQALRFGTLPKVASFLKEKREQEVIQILRSYYTIYLKEEIQAEALVRHLDTFQRFFEVAAQANGQVIEYANISRECAVAQSTVKEYYQILEDTLIGRFLWPFNASERKKARPKFYFFDCGVVHAIQNRLTSEPSPRDKGILFETWFMNELLRIRDYTQKEHKISLWREDSWEIDFLIEGGQGPLVAFECKSGKQIKNEHSLRAFHSRFKHVPLYIVSLQDEHPRKLEEGITLLPWYNAIELYRKL
ncbi:MAG TPA: AAA family ATPase [Bdellovibrionota bacterium]|nr:AAA family ATPase [Bdellovibrionota bacterium]